jgi:hypothetical protein
MPGDKDNTKIITTGIHKGIITMVAFMEKHQNLKEKSFRYTLNKGNEVNFKTLSTHLK